MENKLYYAYVLNNHDLIEYFKNKCREKHVEIVGEESIHSETGKSVMYYVLKAKAGIIDPKWELK